MFRLLGFLIGSLTSIVIILVIIGVPTLHFDDREANQKRYDSAIDKLREKQQEIESVTGRLNDEVTRVAETVGDRIDDMAAINATPDPDPETNIALIESVFGGELKKSSLKVGAPLPRMQDFTVLRIEEDRLLAQYKGEQVEIILGAGFGASQP